MTRALEGVFGAAVEATTKIIAAAAPRRSGKMAEGIKGRIVTPTVGVVYIPSPGAYVIFGTRPHEIRARRAQALHFMWQGGEVFFARVQHPGTKANPFHRKGQLAFPEIYDRLAAGALVSGGASVLSRLRGLL